MNDCPTLKGDCSTMRGDQASCLGEGEAGALQRRRESSGSLGGDNTEGP